MIRFVHLIYIYIHTHTLCICTYTCAMMEPVLTLADSTSSHLSGREAQGKVVRCSVWLQGLGRLLEVSDSSFQLALLSLSRSLSLSPFLSLCIYIYICRQTSNYILLCLHICCRPNISIVHVYQIVAFESIVVMIVHGKEAVSLP